jgi:hypothetical protein
MLCYSIVEMQGQVLTSEGHRKRGYTRPQIESAKYTERKALACEKITSGPYPTSSPCVTNPEVTGCGYPS